jgi:hypothetical protein
MATKAPSGSGNKIICYAPSSGALGAIAFTFDKNTNESFTGDVLTNDLVIELTSLIDNEAFLTFKNSYLQNINITEEEITYTDGTSDKSKTVPSTAPKLVVVHQGGLIDGKRKMTAFEGILGVSQGAKTANTTNEQTVTLTALPASEAYTLAFATLNTDFGMGLTANITFAAGDYGSESFELV